MSSDKVVIQISGLQHSNNSFSASAPGSLQVADNCVITQKGVIQPRQGLDRYKTLPQTGSPDAPSHPYALTEFTGDLICNYAEARDSTDFQLARVRSVAVEEYSGGPYPPVDANGDNINWWRMKFCAAGSGLQFCTNDAPMCLESPAGTPRIAGLPEMWLVQAVRRPNSASPDNNWFDYGKSVAYRSVLRRILDDGTPQLGPPSARTIITNRLVIPAGGLVRVSTTVTVTFPAAYGNVGNIVDVGDSFDLTPGEADFPAGTYTVASVSGGGFTYTDAGAATTSTLQQEIDVGRITVRVGCALPPEATVDTPVRLYRSAMTETETVPNDELFLIDERYPTGGEISAGSMVFYDLTPDSQLGDPLYTNPLTGEGATQSNYAPPIYRDIASWDGRAWFACTQGHQTLRIRMLGVGPDNGVQAGDTLTIDGETITFVASSPGAGDCVIFDQGTPSENITQTTFNLAQTITGVMSGANKPIHGYFMGSASGGSGQIRLQRSDWSTTPFAVSASRIESWTPALPADSTNDFAINGLQYSKLAEPEAVPPVNFLAIGSRNYALRRILPLQNALICLKEGDGIYSVTGTYPYQVAQISTANVTAPDCCAVFADQAWAYTDQGILRISAAGGAAVVSRQVEVELNELYARFPVHTKYQAFAVPYEVERRIMFYVPVEGAVDNHEDPLDTAMEAYCYSNATQSWTKVTRQAVSGVVPITGEDTGVGPRAGRLFLGVFDDEGRVLKERKDATQFDLSDEAISTSITAISTVDGETYVQLSGGPFEVGDGLVQGDYASKIAGFLDDDPSGGLARLYEDVPWEVASATIYKKYDVELQFLPMGNPATRKSLTRLTWAAKVGQFANLAGLSTVMTDQVQAETEISTTFAGFGLTPFGVGSFGNPSPLAVDANPIAGSGSNAAQLFLGFKLSEAWPKLKLEGFVVESSEADGPAGRGR